MRVFAMWAGILISFISLFACGGGGENTNTTTTGHTGGGTSSSSIATGGMGGAALVLVQATLTPCSQPAGCSENPGKGRLMAFHGENCSMGPLEEGGDFVIITFNPPAYAVGEVTVKTIRYPFVAGAPPCIPMDTQVGWVRHKPGEMPNPHSEAGLWTFSDVPAASAGGTFEVSTSMQYNTQELISVGVKMQTTPPDFSMGTRGCITYIKGKVPTPSTWCHHGAEPEPVGCSKAELSPFPADGIPFYPDIQMDIEYYQKAGSPMPEPPPEPKVKKPFMFTEPDRVPNW